MSVLEQKLLMLDLILNLGKSGSICLLLCLTLLVQLVVTLSTFRLRTQLRFALVTYSSSLIVAFPRDFMTFGALRDYYGLTLQLGMILKLMAPMRACMNITIEEFAASIVSKVTRVELR